MTPETRYARSGDVNIAYQVVGKGMLDLVVVLGWVSHVELIWEEPSLARFLDRLASFSRLILFDKRGTGLSDRVADLPTMETRMDDVRAVLDAVGSEKAALLGISDSGPMCALFAATFPARTRALILYGAYAKREWAADYPWAPTPAERQQFLETIEQRWGGVVDLEALAPTVAGDKRFRQWWARYLRGSASPGAALALARMNTAIDIRSALPAISVPALVLHRSGDRDSPIEGGRWMAQQIAGAKFVEVPGDDHLAWVGNSYRLLDEIEEFLTGVSHHAQPERVLLTLMFADIVGSTEHAARLGDRRWKDLLDTYGTIVRRQLDRYRGREIDSAGDGLLSSFDGPGRAIRCACAIRDEMKRFGVETRFGIHTGEAEIESHRVRGMAVHIGARVANLAGAGDVLVSSTVKDLVVGSGIEFVDRGRHALKGVPGSWRIYAAK